MNKLSHNINGRVFTRNTKRSYTHVLVAKFSIEMALAEVKPVNEAKVRKEAEYEHKYAMGLLATPVGEKYYYHRNQGGSYMNKSGKHMVVKAFDHELAEKYHGCYESAEAEADAAVAEKRAMREANIKNIQEQKPEWQVMSWHGSAELAAKAGRSIGPWDVRVEAINGGGE